MLYTFPDYYKQFSCVAGDCEATCCAGWQIVSDEHSLRKYYCYDGDFKKTLNKNINWHSKTFKQDKKHRCAFLNKDNLCDMQLNMGEKSLCKICREYPRHIEEFENVREVSLSVSCPTVADMLLSKKEKTTFFSVEKGEEEVFEDFDLLFYSMLLDARKTIIDILQDRTLPINLRMTLVLGIGHDLQARVNRAEYFSFNDVLLKYSKNKVQQNIKSGLRKYYADNNKRFTYNQKIFRDLYKLEHLVKGYENYLKKVEKCLFLNGAECYYIKDMEFREWCQENYSDYDIMLEQLLVYFVFTYFCGSVYDGDIYGKIYMSVISVFLLDEMIKARWYTNNLQLSHHDIVKIVYTYSRELEHSDINLNRFEKFAKAFTMC